MGGVMFGVLRAKVPVLSILVGVVLCLSSSGISAPAVYASAGCAHPMVLEFNTALGSGTTVTLPLMESGAGATVDWGGAGTANPVGSGSATDQVQVYGASPGEVGFTFTTSGAY